MNISLEALAKLSMLSLEEGNLQNEKDLEAELKTYSKNLELSDLPYEYVLDQSKVMVLREDTVQSSISREKALQNAPKQQSGCFAVPKIV